MNEPNVNPKAREAAQWLVSQLYDDLAHFMPEQIERNLADWMTAFRIVVKGMYEGDSATTIHALARRQATTYYNRIMMQRHHTLKEKTWHVFMLSWALLMACDYFAPKPPKPLSQIGTPDDVAEYLTIESFHFGYFASLVDAVDAILDGNGRLDTKCPYDPPVTHLLHPILIDN